MIYLTGDTHGDFQRIAHFCARMNTKPSDIMIILGDAGINFYGGWRDQHKKKLISALPITVFCIHGNHEQRPATIPSYIEQEWHGGTVYVEEQFPSILFAKDGEVYDLNGMRAIAIGGAYSIDWMLRIPGRSWWPDEQPSPEIKACVESKLDQLGWKIDVVLSHTVPLKHEPVEVFLPGIDQRKVDKSTELWLDRIEERLHYEKWYAGHYHTSKLVEHMRIMFENYDSKVYRRVYEYAEQAGLLKGLAISSVEMTPTPSPQPEPTPSPTLIPTEEPTEVPTAIPTAIPTATPLDASVLYEELKPGSRGQAVLDARMRLYELGYFRKKPTQTEYTKNMMDYVKNFEKDYGLEQDGILSPEDQVILFGENMGK